MTAVELNQGTGISRQSSDLIIDVGAHKGEDSAFYFKLGYRVVSIEANPLLAEYLRKRFQEQIQAGRCAVVEKAVGNTGENVTFYINDANSLWGTADPNWVKRNKKMGTRSSPITVQSVPFSEILKTHGCPHYLKIDVEGADMSCVTALFQTACRPKYISIESTKTSWTALRNEFDTLEKLGYTRFQVIDQKFHNGGAFTDRNGNAVHHEFEQDASGPFGESLGGVWLTKQQALRRYLRIFLLYKTVGDNKLLAKVLWRIPVARRILKLVSWYDTHAMHTGA